MSKCIIIAGRTKTGKTTFVKEKILANHPKNNFIYDVNNEYGLPYCPWNVFLGQCRYKRNTLIVFEEASIFFDTSKGTEQVKEILVRKRHTNNFIVFNFHSLRMVPLYVLDFADTLVLFKTQDTEAVLDRKFKGYTQITNLHKEVSKSTNPHFHRILKLY